MKLLPHLTYFGHCHIWEAESEFLHAGTLKLSSSLERLNRYINDNQALKDCQIDPGPTWRAVTGLIPQLQILDTKLHEALEELYLKAWKAQPNQSSDQALNSKLQWVYFG